jgi:hypothetical protein
MWWSKLIKISALAKNNAMIVLAKALFICILFPPPEGDGY